MGGKQQLQQVEACADSPAVPECARCLYLWNCACFKPDEMGKKKKKLSFVSLKSRLLKSEAPAGSLEQVDAGDEQWAHLLRPLLQLVCDYDVLHKEYP